ncbi:MAG: 2OG-Fe(II) oxygenase [Pseudomonadota bacterium]
MPKTKVIPDQAGLKRVGEIVRNRLNSDPGIYRFDTDQAEMYALADFLTKAECERLCMMIDLVARPSTLHEESYSSGFRTSYSGDLDPNNSFVRGISRRIDDLMGVDSTIGEAIQGQRYQVGQEFKSHHDYFHTNQAYWKGERKRGGQRSWTAMAYLNDVTEGGGTMFNKIGITVEPKPGVLLLWNNANPDGSPNSDTAHAGTPVVKGTKYVITKWYRTRRWT